MSINLFDPYHREPKPRPEPLIKETDSYADLLAIRDGLLDDLVDLESKRHPTESENLNRTLTLRKIQVVQNELLRLTMLSLETKLTRLFGI